MHTPICWSETKPPSARATLQVSDTVHMLETMHETHVGHLLPRVTACHTAAEAFTARCLDCKVGVKSLHDSAGNRELPRQRKQSEAAHTVIGAHSLAELSPDAHPNASPLDPCRMR